MRSWSFNLCDVREDLQHLVIKGVPFTIVKGRKLFNAKEDPLPSYASWWINVDGEYANLKFDRSKDDSSSKWILRAKKADTILNVLNSISMMEDGILMYDTTKHFGFSESDR